jgi:hypothetical protein
MNGEKMWNVLKYRIGEKLMVTSGCSTGLYGWEAVSQDHDTIWLCEGEWDGMSMMEVLEKNQATDKAIVLAVPGGNTFKADWVTIFREKKVRVLYDNDRTGLEGSVKVYNLVKPVARDLQFLHWHPDTEEKFDVRDLYTKQEKGNALTTFALINASLHEMPQGVTVEDLEKTQGKAAPKKDEFTGPGIECEKVYSGFRKWMWLPDSTVIDFMYGVLFANRLPGDPIWGFLVGESGCGKSELLISLTDAPGIYMITNLTPHTLVSGANFSGGGDPSLIPKLNEKVAVPKDFTTILQMNQTARDEIFAILRDAFDGQTGKDFGNGIVRMYKSRFGILSGVTPAIELYTEDSTALGERFLRYYFPTPKTLKDKLILQQRVMDNSASKKEMRIELNQISKDVLNYKVDVVPQVPVDIQMKIMHLANYTALMRSSVPRDKFTKEITHRPFTELPTRLTAQYYKLAQGIGMFKRKKVLDDDEYQVIKKIAIGTVPSRLESFVHIMWNGGAGKGFFVNDIASKIGLPPTTATRVAENLAMINIIKKTGVIGAKVEYKLTEDITSIITHGQIYTERKSNGREEIRNTDPGVQRTIEGPPAAGNESQSGSAGSENRMGGHRIRPSVDQGKQRRRQPEEIGARRR